MTDQGSTIKVEGVEDVLKEIDFLSSLKVNNTYLVPAMKRVGGVVRKDEKPRVAVFTGKTQKDISSRITTNGIGSVTATIGSKKKYYKLRFLDSGAKWGKEQPPANKLVEWVKKKLGASDEEALQVAFRVAKSIGRRGLPAKPIIAPTVESVSTIVVNELNKTIKQMVQELGKHAK